METLSFTLGVLTVIIVAFVAVLVWGIVKVVKHERHINDMQQHINTSIDTIWRSREEDRRAQYNEQDQLHRNLDSRFEETNRNVENQHNDLSMRLDHTESEIYRQINDQITDSVTQSKSYTDSRIDKLIDAYFEYGELNKKKQVIKG